MALTCTTLVSNDHLGHPMRLDALNHFRPISIHNRQYRISGIKSQRLSDNYLNHNSDMGNTFGGRVKQARLDLKLSQTTLAKKSGVSQTTISDIERGRNDGSKDIVQIAGALRKTPEYLLLGKGDDLDTEPAQSLTDEQLEVLAIWEALIPSERAEMRRRAEHNMEVLKQSMPRVVRVSDRRKSQTLYFGHKELRKKDDG